VKSETATIRREAATLAATVRRRSSASRAEKSEGQAKNERSWTVVTQGRPSRSGHE
jgi:hypothetical protein